MILAEVMTGRRSETVAAHLAVCPQCRSMTASAELLGRHLRDPIVWEDPSEGLEADVMRAVVGEQPVMATRRRSWWVGAGAAVLAVLVALGIWFQSRPDWVIELAPGPQAAGAAATVRGWNTEGGTRMVLDVSGLAEASADAFYEVWLSAPDGRRVSAGTFRSPGRIQVNAAVTRADYPRVWVTKEPIGADGSSYRTTVLDSPGG